MTITVVLKGYIKVALEEPETIKNNLDEHIQSTIKEPGCIEFRVEQSSKDECIFNVFERFEDKDAFDAHQERVKTSNWGAITKDVERVFEVKEL